MVFPLSLIHISLESTIISHGMPYPPNVETALNVEKIIRENGAVPATIAVIGGRLKAGLSEAEIDYLGKTGLQAAADDGDGGGHRAVLADDLLHVQGSLHVLGIGHTVRDDGGFQSHHGTALLQGLLHFGSDVQIFVQRHVEFLHKIEI